jgi:hypothetical protein
MAVLMSVGSMPISAPSIWITVSRWDSGRSTGRMRTLYDATLVTSGLPARSSTMPRVEGIASRTFRLVAASVVYCPVAPTWRANSRVDRAPAPITTARPNTMKRSLEGPAVGRWPG